MFLPYNPDTPGGTPVGSSYLKAYISCPRRWFYTYVWPWYEDGRLVGRGLVREDSPRDLALNTGSLFHLGVERYLGSACTGGEDSGKYDLEAGLAAVEEAGAKAGASDREREAVLEAKIMLQNYDRHAGPGGLAPQWPTLKVMCDDQGRPLLERAYWTRLGYRDYVFTCQVDGMVLEHGQVLRVLENKTSAPGMWVDRRLRSLGTDAQVTGEVFTLVNQFREDPEAGWRYLDGVRMHVFIKGWKPGSKSYSTPYKFQVTSRTASELDNFRIRTIGILQEIDDRMAQFEDGLAKGDEIDALAPSLFPNRGMHTDACWDYNRECGFMDLCRIGQTSGVLRGYRQRGSVQAVAFESDEQ